VVDPRTYAFGFGRRVCPGKNFAEQGLFATLSTVIHTLNVGRAKDADGQEVIPEVQMSSGMLCHPRPFAYELRMRDDAKQLVDICTAAVEQ
jgi:cytochrome P450